MQHFLICALLLGCVVAQQCTYNGTTYNEGDGFPSKDGCNNCACVRGSVMCTLMACIKPVAPAHKSGSCPNSTGSFGLCSESCATDSDCEGVTKCCSTGCGHSCQAPIARPNKIEPKKPGCKTVSCLVAPCTTSKCEVEGATCANNYCGGCRAIWTFNGSRVCAGNVTIPRPVQIPRRPRTQPIRTGSCPDGRAPVNCMMAPCAVSKCDVVGATCANNYCGGCKAIWTANGAPVCTVPARPSCATFLCASGSQCINTATGPHCEPSAITQALADQQSTYDSASSSSGNSSVAGWIVVGLAAVVAVALFVVAIMIIKRMKQYY